MTPEWRAKRDKFIAEMDAYLDASAPGALASLTDVDGKDSDFKWLKVVRVARMGSIDRAHLKRQRERKRREEMRKLQRQKAEEEKKVRLNR